MNYNLTHEISWIAEAKKYIGLHEIKGSKHNPTIVGWLKELGSWYFEDESAWCKEGDIEILTSDGFIRLDQLNNKNPSAVAQLDPETRCVSFTNTWNYIEKHYDGEVIDVKAGKLNFTADINHRMWGRFTGSGKYKFRALKDLSNYGIAIPTIFSGQCDANYTDEEIMFIAAFLSDGYYNKNLNKIKEVIFGVSKKRKIKNLTKFNPIKIKTEKNITGVSKEKCTFLHFCASKLRIDAFSEYKLLTWDFISSLSSKQAKLFIDTYKDYDGTIDKDSNAFTVFTNDKNLADQLNYIATMAGYKSTPYITNREHEDKGILYNIYVSKMKHRHFNKNHCKYRNYNGKLYCVQVPTGIFIMRCRNGVIIPTGNCGTFVAAMMKHSNRKIPKYFMRALDWNKDVGRVLDKPAYGCVVTFTRKGGGHVGFCVGKDKHGNLLILGGNQNDAVNIKPFPLSRVHQYIWVDFNNNTKEKAYPLPERYDLPILNINESLSTNES